MIVDDEQHLRTNSSDNWQYNGADICSFNWSKLSAHIWPQTNTNLHQLPVSSRIFENPRLFPGTRNSLSQGTESSPSKNKTGDARAKALKASFLGDLQPDLT